MSKEEEDNAASLIQPQEEIEYIDRKNYKIGNPTKLKLKLLGEGQNCQINNCSRPAYMICGEIPNTGVYPFFVGMICCMAKRAQCGKRLCENHIQIQYNQYGIPAYVCCWNDNGIKTDCKKIQQAECIKFFVGLILLAAFVNGILAILGVF